jgi:hypothetical protein
MGETLRRMYECLNTPKVSPAVVEATWRACGGRPPPPPPPPRPEPVAAAAATATTTEGIST